MGDWAVVIGLALAGSVVAVAVALVLVARREASALRARAAEDAAAVREQARTLLADAERREARLADRERSVVDSERSATERERAAEDAAAELRRDAADARAEAERVVAARRAEADQVARQVLADAERAAGERLADAERSAAQQLADAARAAGERLAEAERAAAERLADAESAATESLEAVSGLTAADARAELVRRLTDEAAQAAAGAVRRAEAQARRSAEARARRIVATAAQRTAAATSAQSTVTVLALPSDEMKGRIIGKEGRNIRLFESLTGVNVLVDETPGSVVLSCFDAERREVARVALDALMADGRINPQRIEAAYAAAVAGTADRTDEAGRDAAERAGVRGLDAELVRLLGRLRVRTSYGQNVLEHVVESAQLAAQVAAELGADVDTARRAALLHDIGKAVTGEVAGTHAQVGAAIAERHGESAAVVNAIAAHHDEVPQDTVEAVLVQVADAMSAARPGARREDIDQHVERLDQLERLVVGHAGVRRALAMAAGRELRVVVEPSQVPDEELGRLAVDIARHIESDLSYPGEIKVTVVREVRASATAG